MKIVALEEFSKGFPDLEMWQILIRYEAYTTALRYYNETDDRVKKWNDMLSKLPVDPDKENEEYTWKIIGKKNQ